MLLFALGPDGTNGHEVAERVIMHRDSKRERLELDLCARNEVVLEEAALHAALGVVPIENGIEGLVKPVINFWRTRKADAPPLYVIGEYSIQISHYLLVKKPMDMSEITAVASHPQALGQCRETLDLLEINDRIPVDSTALAAQRLARGKYPSTTAAIASRFAAEQYGLHIQKERLEDASDNTTRFHLVGPKPTAPTGCDRTAMIFEVEDQSGALVDALQAIRQHGTSMSSIHSIPIGPGTFAFYVEFDRHLQSAEGEKIHEGLQRVTSRIIVLGSFPQEGAQKEGSP